jgi:chorismate synthase
MRRPKSNLSTPRSEKDPYEIISGYFNNATTGTPLTFIIPNNDTRSKDYNKDILRPSHADYTASIKYNNHQDYRGSGHFSGRITTPLVILGSICMQLLEKRGIYIGSHIASIKDKNDTQFTEIDIDDKLIKNLKNSDFPVINSAIEEVYKDEILNAKKHKDSVGGIVETAILNLPAGYGEPFFHSIESTIAHLIYSVPAVKGISFGKGFDITKLFGSEANDQIGIKDNNVVTLTNNSGGINGGISNGMPITFKTAIKPTSSIGKAQKTVDLSSMKETSLELEGRHDPCIVHRVIHVINAVTAYAITEIISREEGTKWMI